jgi:tyrosine-protein phosphatase non-receptor type 9
LTLHIPRESLPLRLGGELAVDHASWLLHCLKSVTNRHGDFCELSPLGPGAAMDSALIATNAATTTVLNGTGGNLEQVCIAAIKEI